MTMQIAIGIGILAALWLLAEMHQGGWWNLIDRVALKLHRAAARGRERHRRATSKLSEDWMRTLQPGCADEDVVRVLERERADSVGE